MSNVSQRHLRAAAKAPAKESETNEYEIVDQTHKPDIRGELGGGKVYVRGGRQFVQLTDRQAMFYRTQGKIVPVASEQAKETAAAKVS